jgi:hypothetical protein
MNASFSKRFLTFAGLLALSFAFVLGSSRIASAQQPAPAVQGIEETDARLERLELTGPHHKNAFPRLGDNFKVLAPSTRKYNCIAWSIGKSTEWVWPGSNLADFDLLYGERGYVRQKDLNLAVVPGKQKIVVYATLNCDATIREVTHAALQQPDGSWTSKLGGLALIQHPTLESLRGPVYGTPVAVYIR